MSNDPKEVSDREGSDLTGDAEPRAQSVEHLSMLRAMRSPVPRMTKATITLRVKRVLAPILRKPQHKLLRRFKLREDLGFDNESLMLLAKPLREEFNDLSISVTPDEVVTKKTIGDLSDLVWDKYRDQVSP